MNAGEGNIRLEEFLSGGKIVFEEKLGLDGKGAESLSWWGYAPRKTRVSALLISLIVAIITFAVFNWLLRSESISLFLVALIVATLTALNFIQAWERSTVKGSSS